MKGQRKSRFKALNFRLWTGLLAAVVIGGGVWGGWVYRGKKWDGQTRFTLIRTDPVIVESFDPGTGEGVRIKVPGTLEVETAGGRGKWQAQVLPQLASKFGKVWVADSVSWFLEVPYTAADGNWGWWDRWAWWRESGKVKWEEVEMGETAWVRQETAPDGVRVLGLSDKWGEGARKRLASVRLAEEDLNVRVVNATGVEGLGHKAANMLETAGMRVVMVAGGAETVQTCEVVGRNEVKDKTGTKFLLSTFGCVWRESGEQNIGDVSLVLGAGFAKRWLGSD